jgi:hypothetical protein
MTDVIEMGDEMAYNPIIEDRKEDAQWTDM